MGWDLFSKKTGRNWARGDSSKKSPKLTSPVGTPPKVKASRNPGRPASPGSFIKPTHNFNIALPYRLRGEIVGGAFVGDEEREMARHGGSAERGALRRRTGSMGEHFNDIEIEDDEDQESGHRQGALSKTARGTGAAVSKGSATASQLAAAAALAKYAGKIRR